MRRAWFEQVPLFVPDFGEGEGRLVDRFDGHWQDMIDGTWRARFSPPMLTLEQARAWCREQAVEVAYVDAAPVPAAGDFHTERVLLLGADRGYELLDEAALVERSFALDALPRRRWTVRVEVSLGFANWIEARRNARAATGHFDGLHLHPEDDAARMAVVADVEAPTEGIAGNTVVQLAKCALTWSPVGLWDEMGDVFGPPTSRRSRRACAVDGSERMGSRPGAGPAGAAGRRRTARPFPQLTTRRPRQRATPWGHTAHKVSRRRGTRRISARQPRDSVAAIAA